MGGEGSISAMIASMKNNNRRKNKNKPFSNYVKEYSKGKPISAKEMTPKEKEIFLQKLKENRDLEKQQHIYKLFISLVITIVAIGGFVFMIKFIFF
jgi:hypothetical protein